MPFNNLCSSCTNIGCEFQSGIVRTKCAFYMPPHIESDNCGNYVVMQPTYEARLNADIVAILDKIRERIELEKLGYPPSAGYYKAIMKCLQIIDKYKGESEDAE